VQSGRLGRLALADATIKWYRSQDYYDDGGWKGTWALDGGGALMNQSIHTIDLLNYLAGPVTQVTGRAATLAHRMETEDTAAAVLQFASGALGVIEGSTACWPGESSRVELHGDQGSLRLEDGRITAWKLAGGSREEAEAMVRMEVSLGGGATAATAIGHELHRRQLADFVEAVRDHRPPRISGEEARHSVAIIRAIYEASRKGGWISL
jgi:predicted dehydrogenase